MTQSQAAKRLGIGYRQYQRYEAGDARPIPDSICRLVALGALETDVSESLTYQKFTHWNKG